jgi:hypothetical protein
VLKTLDKFKITFFAFGCFVLANNVLDGLLMWLFTGHYYIHLLGYYCNLNEDALFLFSNYFWLTASYILMKLVIIPFTLWSIKNKFLLKSYVFLFLVYDAISLISNFIYDGYPNPTHSIFFSNGLFFVFAAKLNIIGLMAVATTFIAVAWMWVVTNKFPTEKSKLMGVLIYSILSMVLFYFATRLAILYIL